MIHCETESEFDRSSTIIERWMTTCVPKLTTCLSLGRHFANISDNTSTIPTAEKATRQRRKDGGRCQHRIRYHEDQPATVATLDREPATPCLIFHTMERSPRTNRTKSRGQSINSPEMLEFQISRSIHNCRRPNSTETGCTGSFTHRTFSLSQCTKKLIVHKFQSNQSKSN